MSKLTSIVLKTLIVVKFKFKIFNKLCDNNAHPEEVVCSPAKSFIGQPINIKTPIPVGKTKYIFIRAFRTCR
jgi:hypothetical protein